MWKYNDQLVEINEGKINENWRITYWKLKKNTIRNVIENGSKWKSNAIADKLTHAIDKKASAVKSSEGLKGNWSFYIMIF